MLSPNGRPMPLRMMPWPCMHVLPCACGAVCVRVPWPPQALLATGSEVVELKLDLPLLLPFAAAAAGPYPPHPPHPPHDIHTHTSAPCPGRQLRAAARCVPLLLQPPSNVRAVAPSPGHQAQAAGAALRRRPCRDGLARLFPVRRVSPPPPERERERRGSPLAWVLSHVAPGRAR